MIDINYKAICDYNRELSCLITELFNPIVDEFDITLLQVRVLDELDNLGKPTSIGYIGQLMGMSSGNVSSFCKKLMNNGYIEKSRGGKDERIVTITITEKGKQIISAVKDRISERLNRGLEETDMKCIESIMTSIKNTVELLNKIKSRLT